MHHPSHIEEGEEQEEVIDTSLSLSPVCVDVSAYLVCDATAADNNDDMW